MPEASTLKLTEDTFLATPDLDGNIDLAPLGVAVGQRFQVEAFDDGVICLTPVD